jgi:hypothetical protein
MTRNSLWAIGAVALLGLAAAGCTPADPPAEPEPTASEPAPDPEETEPEETETVAPEVDPVFVGDDLERVLLDADRVGALFPSVTSVSDASDFDASVGETEGQIGDPAVCMPLLWTADWALTAGARHVQWQGDDDSLHYGQQYAVQAPSVEQAEESFDWYEDAADECDTFTPREDITDITYEWAVGSEEEREDVEVIVGTLSGGGEGSEAAVQIQARAGNALVSISTSLGEALDADPGAIATSVADALESAIGELEPGGGSLPEAPEADGAAPLSEWEAGVGGIGPIRIGDSIDDVMQAVDWVEEPVEGENFFTYEPQSTWTQPFDGGTVNITLTDDRVSGVEVAADDGAPDPDGSGLPSAGGVRIGDTALAAAEAFPGGTVFYKLAPGVQQYSVADADGRILAFSAPGVVNENDEFGGYTLENGVITAIAVEDATQRESMYETYTTWSDSDD